MVYTALCAAALSPLLQAARSEGLLPVAQALLNVAAGVGGSLIAERLEKQNLTFATDALHDQLEQGRALLLLDGLDEIPTPRQRIFIRDAVTTFARRYRQCRLVVTCRTLSYQQPEWQLGEFETCTLAPFTDEQIDAFIAGWHVELARLGSITPGAVDGATRHLQAAVCRPDLWRLASNPLLLTVITLMRTHKGRLPEARALLYKVAVEILLWRWDQVRVLGDTEPPRLQQLLTQANSSTGKIGCTLGQTRHLLARSHSAGSWPPHACESDDGGSAELDR
jgi:predicted NACHT family NTPase